MRTICLQSNEKLVNRVQHVKKQIKRYKRERRYLIGRLDEHGDSFREAQVPAMWEVRHLVFTFYLFSYIFLFWVDIRVIFCVN
jgi:hypothetical protein